MTKNINNAVDQRPLEFTGTLAALEAEQRTVKRELAQRETLSQGAAPEASSTLGLPEKPTLLLPTVVSAGGDCWKDVADSLSDIFNSEALSTEDQTNELATYQTIDQQISQSVLVLTNAEISKQTEAQNNADEITQLTDKIKAQDKSLTILSYCMLALGGLSILVTGGLALADFFAAGPAVVAGAEGGAAGAGAGAGAGADASAGAGAAGASAPADVANLADVSADVGQDASVDADQAGQDSARAAGRRLGANAVRNGANNAARGAGSAARQGVEAPSKYGALKTALTRGFQLGTIAATVTPQALEAHTNMVMAEEEWKAAETMQQLAPITQQLQKTNAYFDYNKTMAQRKSNLVSTFTDQLSNILQIEGSLMQGINQISRDVGKTAI